MRKHNERGQAVIELALLGSMTIFVFSVLVNYIQRFNDQQYMQMKVFRIALEKACNHDGSSGAGSSVEMNILETRRQASVNGDFGKGVSQPVSASASVNWAIPGDNSDKNDDEDQRAEKNEPLSLFVYRVNDNEKTINKRKYVPYDQRKKWYFTIEDTVTDTDTEYTGTVEKQEDAGGITNSRSANLKETIHTNITCAVKKKDSGGGDTDKDTILKKSEFWDVTQGAYRDSNDGQYKYSEQVVGKELERERTWRTDF